jgi:hypothetical protein
MWDGNDEAEDWEDKGGDGDLEDPIVNDLVLVPQKV